MKLIVDNRTDYTAKSIKAFYKPIAEHEGLAGEDLFIRAVNQYRGGAKYNHSKAKYGCYWVELAIWRPEDLHEDRKKKLIQIAMHEFAHCRGLHHKDMGDCYSFETSWFPKDLNLEVKQASNPLPKDIKKERYENAKKHLKEAEAKVKRWGNVIKKWKKKVKYYEKSGLVK